MMADELGYGSDTFIGVGSPVIVNGDDTKNAGKRPFLIAVGGGTASGKVSRLAFL